MYFCIYWRKDKAPEKPTRPDIEVYPKDFLYELIDGEVLTQNRGTIKWRVPFGDMPALGRHPALKDVKLPAPLGIPGAPGVLATVTAEDSSGASYTLTYELGIAYRERPYVEFIEVIPTDT